MFWKPWQKPATKIVSMNCTELILMITAVSAISQLFDVSKIYLCQVTALSSILQNFKFLPPPPPLLSYLRLG